MAPNRDPRDEFETPILKSDVLSIEDLKEGMKLSGTVRNVVDFSICRYRCETRRISARI